MASSIKKGVHTPMGVECDDPRFGIFKGDKWIPMVPAFWNKNQWVKTPPYYLWSTENQVAYPITSNDLITITATGAPTSGKDECVILTADVTTDFCVKMRLDKWETAVARGVRLSQLKSLPAYEAGNVYSCGGSIKDKEASDDSPGVFVDVTIQFKAGGSNLGDPIVKSWANAGSVLDLNKDGSINKIVPDWTSFSNSSLVPETADAVWLEISVYQTTSQKKTKVFLDDCWAEVMNANAYRDSYLLIEREILDFDALVYGDRLSYFHIPYGGRGKRGTLKAKHKNKTEGKIAKIIGGTTKKDGHPLNILLRLLLSSNNGTNNYDPDTHQYDAGDGFGRGLSTKVCSPRVTNDDRDNSVVDVVAIETLRDETACGYDDYLAEFRFTVGIPNFKEWAEAEIMRPFGYRWTTGENGKISVARIAPLYLDEERAGVMASGVFTPTDAPGWFSTQWTKDSIATYLWVKDLNQTYLISENTATTVTVGSPPADGSYICAILPKPKTSTYPYVAEINERDFEGIPEIGYTTDIVNKITWKFDFDPSNTVDNRHNSRHLTLEEYDESSFWGDAFYDGADSSFTQYEEQNLDIKSGGLRGAGTSKFANGYNLNGNKVARRVTYDNLRKWREHLPELKGTVGLKFVHLDAGDVVRVKHPKIWDVKTGKHGIDKLCQLSELRHDLMKKKITLVGHSWSDVKCPPLLAPFTIPTIQNYMMGIKHPPPDVIEKLKVRDYPFWIGNLYFLRQTYSATSAADSKARKWQRNRATGLWTPQDEIDYLNEHGTVTPQWYRHTNIYVSKDGVTYTQIAETTEPYIYFAWEADDDTTVVDTLYVKFSYSTNSYNAVTGEYQESAWYPETPDEQTAIDPYKKAVAGVDLGQSNEMVAATRATERLTSDRRYSKLGDTM